jgi:hypothetical protein
MPGYQIDLGHTQAAIFIAHVNYLILQGYCANAPTFQVLLGFEPLTLIGIKLDITLKNSQT